MEPRLIRRHLRTILGSASLLTASLAGAACIEGVVEVPEDELVGEHEQEATQRVETLSLDLDGVSKGSLASTAGGVPVVEVATSVAGSVVKKDVKSVSIEALRMEMAFGTFTGIQDWVDSAWNGKVVRKDGSVVADRVTSKVVTDFTDALLTEVTIPALDASSKDVARFGIAVLPTQVERTELPKESKPRAPVKVPNLLASNFRVTLGDLPCTRIVRIDPFTVKSGAATSLGTGREREVGSAVNFPDLRVTFSATDAAHWEEYAQAVLKDGRIDDSEELSGSIEFLSANLKDVLATLKLQNVGIKRLAPVPASESEALRYQADLYVEKISFESASK
jgi:hypothetical protein